MLAEDGWEAYSPETATMSAATHHCALRRSFDLHSRSFAKTVLLTITLLLTCHPHELAAPPPREQPLTPYKSTTFTHFCCCRCLMVSRTGPGLELHMIKMKLRKGSPAGRFSGDGRLPVDTFRQFRDPSLTGKLRPPLLPLLCARYSIRVTIALEKTTLVDSHGGCRCRLPPVAEHHQLFVVFYLNCSCNSLRV